MPDLPNPLADLVRGLQEGLSGLKGNAKSAYDDLEFFSRWVMAEGNPAYSRNSLFLRRIYYAYQYTGEDLLILGPRGSAKSTAVTVTATAWTVGRNPLIRAMLAFASQEVQGLAFVRQIEHILTNNDRYIEIFGRLKPDKPERWTDTEMIVQRPTPPGGLKDPTIAVVGLNSAVPSKRADLIVGDDLVTLENAYSPVLRKKVIQFVNQSLFPIMAPGGRKVIVGSKWHRQDLYTDIAQKWGLKLPRSENIVVSEILKPYIDQVIEEQERAMAALDDMFDGMPDDPEDALQMEGMPVG